MWQGIYLTKSLGEDEKIVLAALNRAHDQGKISLTFPEVVDVAELPRTRVKSALGILEARGLVGFRNVKITSIYYVKKRITVEKGN